MTLDLSKYIVEERPPSEKVSEEISEENLPQFQEPLDLDRYLSEEESTTFDNFKRHAARVGSRVGETVVGFPGDFVKFVQFMADKLPHVPTGKPNALQELGRKGLEKLPTSEDVKQLSEQFTGGYTKAQTPSEELGDEIASLTTALMIPARDPRKFTNLLKTIGMATAAKGVGKGAEALGAGPKTVAAAEVGTLFLTGLMGKKLANQYISEKYQQAKSSIPSGDIIPTSRLLQGLESVEKELSKGVTTPTKSEVMGPLRELKNKAAGGGMLAEDAVQAYHDINERLTAKKLFEDLSKSERHLLRKRYDMVRDELRSSLKDYGEKNPKFWKEWSEANQGYATLQKSKKVSDYINRNLPRIKSHLAGTVALELFTGHPQMAVATAGGAAAAYGATKTGELLYRISKSPTLRKHYADVIKSASAENSAATIKALQQLEKELEKKEQ